MSKKYKKTILSLFLIFIIHYIFLRAISENKEITKEMIGHLILISLVVFYLFSIHFKEIIDFFEKIPKILGFIVFWGALFGIIYILSLLSIDWTISFYGIFFTSIVFAVVESIYE